MTNEEAATRLKKVRQELGEVSSAHSLDHYVDKATDIISKFEVQPDHQSKATNSEFDIKHDAIQSLYYSLDREGGWAKNAGSGILKSNAKKAEAQKFLDDAIYHLQTNIDEFLRAMEL